MASNSVAADIEGYMDDLHVDLKLWVSLKMPYYFELNWYANFFSHE
jgi:hypothetical protein